MATANTKESAQDTLKTKLIQLGRAKDKSDNALKAGKEHVIRRHIETLKESLKEVSKWHRESEAEKISSKEDLDEIDKWSNEIEGQMEEADQKIGLLEQWLNDTNVKREEQQRQGRINFELKLEEAKIKLKADYAKVEASPSESSSSASGNIEARLPKLVITKFDGTYADWPRFWGQYSETIDKSGTPPVTKFSYLRELLCEKAKKAIEALPYNAEGYNRAVAILKDRFGKDSEVVKAYVKEILDLPYIPSSNPKRILDSYEKLVYSVQSLETLKKLDAVNGTVLMTLEKLPHIRGDLVRNDAKWEEWTYVQLTEALRLWTRRNPVESKQEDPNKKERRNQYHLQTQQGKLKQKRCCVYCDAESHRSSECDQIVTLDDRKKLLATKKRCFNCTGTSPRASQCKSTSTCKHCNKRHHTSICDAEKDPEPALTARKQEDQEEIYPIVLVEVDRIRTHALLDTGSGSSYASITLINALKKRPKEVKTKRIEMMLTSSTTRVEIYSANLKSLDSKFDMNVELSKVDKPELMTVKNPEYTKLLQKFSYLRGTKLNDPDSRAQIPIHVVLGASDYAMIKTTTAQRVGLPGQPIAERTLLGWTVMFPGSEEVDSSIMLTRSTSTDYEQLFALDVLGLADSSEDDQQTVYSEFNEQLRRNEAGWYETKLPWKGNHPFLPTNQVGSE